MDVIRAVPVVETFAHLRYDDDGTKRLQWRACWRASPAALILALDKTCTAHHGGCHTQSNQGCVLQEIPHCPPALARERWQHMAFRTWQ